MGQSAYWQVFVQAKSHEKARKLLDRLAAALGRDVVVVSCDQYWKDKSLYRAMLNTLIPAADMAAVVVEMLRVCSGVARSWVVGAPELYEGGQWEFSGSAVRETITLSGVTDIDFRVGNLRAPEATGQATEESALQPS